MYGEGKFNLFRKMVAIEAGHCDYITTPDGDVIPQAKSLSYDELDDIEFEKVFGAMMNVCAEILHNMDKNDLYKEVVRYAVEHMGMQP